MERSVAMAGRGRASVADMKRVEFAAMRALDRAGALDGDGTSISRRKLGELIGVSPFRARAALERLQEDGLIELAPQFGADGGQMPNGVVLTENGKWFLEGFYAGCEDALLEFERTVPSES